MVVGPRLEASLCEQGMRHSLQSARAPTCGSRALATSLALLALLRLPLLLLLYTLECTSVYTPKVFGPQ